MYKSFEELFTAATKKEPYPYQVALAYKEDLPSVISVPTGGGKTAAVVLSWLWRRRYSNNYKEKTPRRLVYCLPMRTLVEQTKESIQEWLNNLGIFSQNDENAIKLTVLMGGERKRDWDIYPENDQIIVGTQDMLLSRALNRGYSMSRYRWPMHFGLLNNDTLWIMDEIQLMGSGLTTSLQLQGLRQSFGVLKQAHTIWMSATVDRGWLKTVDFSKDITETEIIALTQKDLESQHLRQILNAPKVIKKLNVPVGDLKSLARETLKEVRPNSRTIVILNTVERAVKLYDEILNALEQTVNKPQLILVHSRFRPPDRERAVDEMKKDPGENGSIVISTQVIEAGVDISSSVMFTELAPLSSMIQRFGRCNRYGECRDARIYWLDINDSKMVLPYTVEDIEKARNFLLKLEGQDVSPNSIRNPQIEFRHGPAIRRKDVIELFDTTHDLTGGDVDISRFIRDTVDSEVQVFWRKITQNEPSSREPRPGREELCPVLVSDAKKVSEELWKWDPLEGKWEHPREVYPGMVLMLSTKSGHYDKARGWSIDSREPVEPKIGQTEPNDDYESNSESVDEWKSISEHTDEVVNRVRSIAIQLSIDQQLIDALLMAARWHDAGKAHDAFQERINLEGVDKSKKPVAKAPKHAWKQGNVARKYFRHELVSGLLAIQNGCNDLVAYLAAAHHGKIRLSIRSLPGESIPDDQNRRFAMGVWDGDLIPETDLGGGVKVKCTKIDLSIMSIGGTNGPSWVARMTELRDKIGPFKLAYLEALLKASDERASGGK